MFKNAVKNDKIVSSLNLSLLLEHIDLLEAFQRIHEKSL